MKHLTTFFSNLKGNYNILYIKEKKTSRPVSSELQFYIALKISDKHLHKKIILQLLTHLSVYPLDYVRALKLPLILGTQVCQSVQAVVFGYEN